MSERGMCQGRVWTGHSFGSCSYKAVQGRDFCKIHDPVIVEKKRAERDAKWKAEYDAKDKARKHAKAIMEAERAVIDAARHWAGLQRGPIKGPGEADLRVAVHNMQSLREKGGA